MINLSRFSRTPRSLLLCLALTGAIPAVAAPPVPSGDQAWYYAIGGAEPISSILNPYAANWTLYGDASLSAS